jgi:hypothetical protein
MEAQQPFTASGKTTHPASQLHILADLNLLLQWKGTNSLANYNYHTTVPNSSDMYLHIYFPPNLTTFYSPSL